tara:strand:- start:702 stop:935 length:234 start_codon:yes stop_codon:yes gene_type:complete
MPKRKNLTKKDKKELQSLIDEIILEAKGVTEDYEQNPSEMSGSVVHIHENSPYLDSDGDDETPLYSGSRWTKVLKSF